MSTEKKDKRPVKTNNRQMKLNIKHIGWRLMLRNLEFNKRPSEKQKVPRFVKGELFDSRCLAHEHLRLYFPTYTAKDYRIVGVKVSFTPNDYAPIRREVRPVRNAAEKIGDAVVKA